MKVIFRSAPSQTGVAVDVGVHHVVEIVDRHAWVLPAELTSYRLAELRLYENGAAAELTSEDLLGEVAGLQRPRLCH